MREKNKEKDLRILSAPLEVFLSLTNHCNLGCSHCSVSSSPSVRVGELSTLEWLDLIREMRRMKVFTVRISGGEPFTHPDLFQILKEMVDSGMRVSINTNATLIGREEARALKEISHWIDDIMVSLDGSTAEVHDRLRGEGSFRRAIRGIEALLAEDLPVSLYTTVVRYNWRDLEGIVLLASEMAVTGIKFNELIPMGRALNHYRELSLKPWERRTVLRSLRNLKGSYEGFIAGTYVDLLEIISSIESPSTDGDPYLNTCSAGTTEVAIRPDGWTVPCDRLYNYKVGDIRKEGLEDIWHRSEALNRFRERFQLTIDDLPECKDCRYKCRCGGGCPAVPYNLGKGILSRDPLSCYRILKGEEEFSIDG